MSRWVCVVALAGALVASACGGSSDDAADEVPATTEPPATTTVPATTTTDTPTTTTTSTTTSTVPPPVVPTIDRVVLSGEPEVVFDWTTDRCYDRQIPDIATRAIRNADGLVHLYVGHDTTHRMTGPDLESLTLECDAVVMSSNNDPDPARYDEARWLSSPYTQDGEAVYGILHHEFRGFVAEGTDTCVLGDYISCIDVSLTMAISTDGGATFDHIAEPPGHLIGTLPYTYVAAGEPSGIWHVSNVIEGDDGFWYLMASINAYDDAESGEGGQWNCLLRTPDLDDTMAWRYWTGRNFNGVFLDPYREAVDTDELCAPVARPQIGAEINESITWDHSIGRYVAVGMSNDPSRGGRYGLYASFSDDLLTWTTRELVLELPMGASVADPLNDVSYAYPSLLDPDSESLNFDTTDGSAYVYITRFNAGGDSLDRDLLRYPVTIAAFEPEPVTWSFDAEGDAEGWDPTNQLESFVVTDGVMSTVTTGDDPYMESSGFRTAADGTPTLYLRMRAVTDGPRRLSGQIFWLTDDEPLWGGDKFAPFQINSEGEWIEYEIDLSSRREWKGVITALRIDPGTLPGAIIEFDTIELR